MARWLIAVFLLQLGAFATISQLRLVDGDEGFYLLTSRLVTEGKLPYHDFLLTQMPLLPYAYGWWTRLAGMTWISARALSAILAALLGTALFSEVRAQTGRWGAGAAAVLLFVTSTHVFAWFTIVKTYALSTLLLFLAYRMAVRCAGEGRVRWWIAGGMCLGASADVRLYFAGLLPVFLWWIYRYAKTGGRAAALACFVGGFALATMPNLYLLARDPQAYWFGNLGFHAIRTDEGLVGGLDDKIETIEELFQTGGEGNGVQMGLLSLTILLLAVRRAIAAGGARLALALALVLSFICLLPTPAYVQYFCGTIPFFIVVVVCSASKLLDALPDGKKRRALVVSGVVALIFAGSGIPDYGRFLSGGDEVSGIEPELVRNWRIPAIAAVSRAIDERIRPGERVMSLWPGYIFQSKAEPYPGLENNSATYMAGRLSPEQLARYHILSPGGILAAIAAHKPRLVVLGNQESMLVEPEPFEKALIAGGYKVVSQIDDTRIWLGPALPLDSR